MVTTFAALIWPLGATRGFDVKDDVQFGNLEATMPLTSRLLDYLGLVDYQLQELTGK